MNTNHQKTITMKTLRKTILAAALALAGLVCALPAQAQQWAGSYMAEHEAGETAGGSYIGYILTLELNYLDDGNYTGTMQIDGYMTMLRANVYAEEKGKTVTVYYDTPQEDNMGLNLGHGTPIVTLGKTTYKGKGGKRRTRITATWSNDMIESEYVDKTTKVKK